MRGTFIGNWLDDFIEQFSTEEEGEGTAIVPHFFLLFGCALPVLISDVFNSIHAYSGMFALCITDASVLMIALFLLAHMYLGCYRWYLDR